MKKQMMITAILVGATLTIMAGPAENLLVLIAGGSSVSGLETFLNRGGVDINGLDSAGQTALTMAVQKGNTMVNVLLAHGADVNKPNAHGNTALMLATQAGNLFLVRMFLDHGADITLTGKSGETALNIAAQQAFEEKATAAKRSAYVGIIATLLKHGANANARASGAETALMLAAQGGADAVVSALLTSGAQVNVYANGATALTLAAFKGNAAVVKMLLAHGAQVNVKDIHGMTALMYAAARRDVRMVSALLAHPEIDVNIQDKDKKTAYYYAKKNPDIKKLFDGYNKKRSEMVAAADKLHKLELEIIALVGQEKWKAAHDLLERNAKLASKSEKLARFKGLIHEELAAAGGVSPLRVQMAE